METRTYQQLWQSLNPEDKQKLGQFADTTYDNLKYMAHKKGRCSKRMARDITLAFIAMETVSGDLDELLPVIFPQFVMSAVPTHAQKMAS